jgi:excisionase family DNA binding protein
VTGSLAVTVQEAANALGISKGSALRLLAAGILPAVPPRGNRRMVAVDAVRELQQRPDVAPDAPMAFVVRIGGPLDTEDTWRDKAGWSADWTWEAQTAGVRGDWVIDPAPVLQAGVLVVVIGNFVAAAYAVTGLEGQFLDEGNGRRRSRFIVAADEKRATPFVGHRWALGGGWAAAVVGKK